MALLHDFVIKPRVSTQRLHLQKMICSLYIIGKTSIVSDSDTVGVVALIPTFSLDISIVPLMLPMLIVKLEIRTPNRFLTFLSADGFIHFLSEWTQSHIQTTQWNLIQSEMNQTIWWLNRHQSSSNVYSSWEYIVDFIFISQLQQRHTNYFFI